MKTCPYCQRQIPDEDVKCKHCGGWFTNDGDTRQQKLDEEARLAKLLGDKGPHKKEGGEDTVYFYVPVKKFIILSAVTMALYEYYWFYKNWKAVKIQEGAKIRPFWRAVFAVLFVYPLFKRILGTAKKKGHKAGFSHGSLTAAYIAITVLHKLPDPWWWLSVLSFVPIIPAVQAVRFQNSRVDPGFSEARGFRRGEIVLIWIGICLWTLTIFGIVFPE